MDDMRANPSGLDPIVGGGGSGHDILYVACNFDFFH